jgi:hypothetical protein
VWKAKKTTLENRDVNAEQGNFAGIFQAQNARAMVIVSSRCAFRWFWSVVNARSAAAIGLAPAILCPGRRRMFVVVLAGFNHDDMANVHLDGSAEGRAAALRWPRPRTAGGTGCERFDGGKILLLRGPDQ